MQKKKTVTIQVAITGDERAVVATAAAISAILAKLAPPEDQKRVVEEIASHAMAKRRPRK